jgi:predicted nucleic acid-binding protein
VIILDTNAVSEALKPAPSESVLRWLAAQQFFLSTNNPRESLQEFSPAARRLDARCLNSTP